MALTLTANDIAAVFTALGAIANVLLWSLMLISNRETRQITKIAVERWETDKRDQSQRTIEAAIAPLNATVAHQSAEWLKMQAQLSDISTKLTVLQRDNETRRSAKAEDVEKAFAEMAPMLKAFVQSQVVPTVPGAKSNGG